MHVFRIVSGQPPVLMVWVWAICGCATEGPSAPPSATQPAPQSFVEVPNPRSSDNPRFALEPLPAPAPGASIRDPRFGTAQRRVVQAERLRHEYSRHDPFNRDQSLILLQYLPDGEWRIYSTAAVPYDQSGSLLRTVDLAEPRWDPDSAELLWGFREFKIVRINVRTGTATVVKDFSTDPAIRPLLTSNPDLYRITMKDEGEPSADFRHWAFLLQGTQDDYRMRAVATWDRQADRVEGVYPLPAAKSRIDWVGMSPRGQWVLIGADFDNGGPLAGLTLADRALKTFHPLDADTAHADVGLDSGDREVIVMQSNRSDSIDMIPISPDSRPVSGPDSDVAGSGRVRLIRLFYDSESALGLNSGVHISCNAPGYCVVSTFTEPGRREQNWLDRTILLVRLDPRQPRAIYLSKVHGTAGAYWEETQASISRDARRVVWATNWGRAVGEERVWMMEMRIPPQWLSMLER